jgi:hypothetical protein
MNDYQQRVRDERDALQVKIDALGTFVGGHIYQSLHEIDQQLLSIQLDIMRDYVDTLNARIERFA